MLTTVIPMLQRDRVWNLLTRRRDGNTLGSDGGGRRRVAFGDGILFVGLFAFSGLVVIGSVLLMLLFWAAATLPPSMLRSCSEFDLCGAPASDGNESLSVDDPLTGEPRITR